MRTVIAAAVLALCCSSCATTQRLDFPPLPDAPEKWHPFSTETIAGSVCPPIEGVYLEPPSVYRLGEKRKFLPKDDNRLFLGYVPLNRAKKSSLPLTNLYGPREGFVIRQVDASNFYFSFLNYDGAKVLEYHFRSDEGDFECRNGYIEFPTLISYGMVEGRTNNFQIRNILLMDESGALVIQSTRGPYKGTPSKMKKEVSYEFIRYPRKNGEME